MTAFRTVLFWFLAALAVAGLALVWWLTPTAGAFAQDDVEPYEYPGDHLFSQALLWTYFGSPRIELAGGIGDLPACPDRADACFARISFNSCIIYRNLAIDPVYWREAAYPYLLVQCVGIDL